MHPFWNEKRVLVTGNTGFKGAWLCLWLLARGARVSGYSLAPPTRPSLHELAGLDADFETVLGDVRDLERLRATVQRVQPEIVIHMAAQSLVRYSFLQPVETYATNVMGTVHLLEALRDLEATRAVLVVTSDKCYANHDQDAAFTEDSPMGGHDPYSSSKGCAELVVASYRQSFPGLPAGLASARAGNVIGGGDWADNRLIPDLIAALRAGQPVPLRYPQATRPWQHVLDPLAGYLSLLEKLYTDGPAYAGPWNFGPAADSQVWSVGQIADHLARLWGTPLAMEHLTVAEPEAQYLRLDCQKAHSRLGWRARLDVKTTLRWVVEWYQAHREGADLKRKTLEQIEQYEGARV